jgi:alkylation response protein AidB-like acyl-CoA dehydrogenase
VRFAFTEEQRMFAGIVREVLEEACPPKAVRAAAGFSSERWSRLAEVGLLGLTAPEEHGGSAASEVDLVLALEETGYACLPEPVVESYLACSVLLDAPLGNDWLTAIASGESLATIGPASLVADADVAHLVLTGTDDGILAREGPVEAEPRPSLDPTRRLFAVSPEGAPVEASWGNVLDRGAFATAAQLAGIGRRVIEMASEYARERRQFGVPIGSFQAVKHLLATAHLAVEFARPVVYRAAWSLAAGDPNRSRDASMAKAMAGDAAVTACRAALQVHGAIGYTEEHDLHLWLRRGLALESAWGNGAEHLARVRAALLG